MNNNKDNLKDKVSDSSILEQNATDKSVIEVAKTRSIKDMVLWLLIVSALIGSTLITQYLPGYWQPANNKWIQFGIITLLIIVSVICFFFTNQGKAFKTLLTDAGVELRRVTWPTKDETIKWTWLSIVFMFVFGLLIWVLDTIFNQIVGIFIG